MSGSASIALNRLSAIIPADRVIRANTNVPTETQGTRWRGASQTLRSMSNWLPRIGSPTADMPAIEQRTLRARARDAMRSNMLARAVITRCRTNIVGVGMVCQPTVDATTLGISEEAAEQYNAAIRAEWERWADDPQESDWESTLDFYGLQGLALVSALCSGDVFAITPARKNPGGVTELKLQLVEADRISNPRDAQDTDTLIDGIEFADGMPIACHVRNTHPGAATTSGQPVWTRMDYYGMATGRRRVLHIWNDKERPGQVRGAPYLAPILEPLKQLDRYADAELMAAVVSAMFTVFIEREADAPTLFDAEGNPVEMMSGAAPSSGEAAPLNLGRGAVVDMAPGEKPHVANPSRPNANFDPFFAAVVKQIGAALELPIDELLLQYNASYSAARAAMLQAWRFYNARRWMLVQQLCQPMYGLLLDEAVAAGRLSLHNYADPIMRRAWSRALWIGPARGAMDEHREAQAAKTRIEIGISNETMETAAMTGEDWNAVYAQRARELARRRADGSLPQSLNSSAPPAIVEPVVHPSDDPAQPKQPERDAA